MKTVTVSPDQELTARRHLNSSFIAEAGAVVDNPSKGAFDLKVDPSLPAGTIVVDYPARIQAEA